MVNLYMVILRTDDLCMEVLHFEFISAMRWLYVEFMLYISSLCSTYRDYALYIEVFLYI